MIQEITPLVIPVVNLHGDKPNTLIDQYGEAVCAIDRAIKMASKAYPNARNYKDMAHYDKARKSHNEKMRILQDIRNEFDNALYQFTSNIIF